MVEELKADVLQTLLDEGAAVQIVDVRTPESFASGHIPGSENVPFETLVTSIESVAWEDRIVFVCPYGQRSQQACQLLAAFEGIPPETEVYNLKGGLQAWDGPIAVAHQD